MIFKHHISFMMRRAIYAYHHKLGDKFPMPGIKLGMANIITVHAVYHFRAGEAMMLVFCRIFLAAVFSGNMMALAYSFAGSVLCLAGMLLLRKIIDKKHIWIASVLRCCSSQYRTDYDCRSGYGNGRAGLPAVSIGVGLSCRSIYRRLCAVDSA